MPSNPSRAMSVLRRLALGVLAVALGACSGRGGRSIATFTPGVSGRAVPWTHAQFDTSSARFAFGIVSDLNGGERRDVFRRAVAQLALLRPELVMSVGDLIDGPTTNADSLAREWEDFDGRARAMPAPFFRVGGNHDLTGEALRDVWRGRYGPTYYAFVYKEVLFLVLDTEDLTPERAREIFEARTKAVRAAAENQGGQDTLSYYRMQERATGDIGAEQAAYVRRAIADHPEVRWTFLFFHKPVWRNPDDTDFKAIEAALAERPYTVFSGHLHSFARELRNGREYYSLGTTGGGQDPRDPMAFDHLTWVTMDADGPSIVLMRLEGVLGGDGKTP